MKENRELVELTSARFFAALLIVFFHNFSLSALEPAGQLASAILSTGYLAVGFFFVLSGFILGYTYQNDLAQGPGALNAKRFLVKRLARIYPLFLLGLLLDAPRAISYFIESSGFVAGSLKAAMAALANLSLLQSWHPRIAPAWNTPGWSLSAEMFFYACFPLLAPQIWRLRRSAIGVICLALFFASMLLILPFVIATAQPGQHEMLLTAGRYLPALHLPEFLLGICVARLRSIESLSLWRSRLDRWGFLFGLLAALAVISLYEQIPMLVFHNGLLAPIFSLMIFSLASENAVGASVLRRPTLAILGRASYAVYILHQPLKNFVLWSARNLGLTDSVGLFLIYLIVVIGASLAAYSFIEVPAREYLVRRFSARQSSLRPTS